MSLCGWFRVYDRLSVVEESMLELQKAVEAAELNWITLRKRCKNLLLQAEAAEARLHGDGSVVDSEHSVGTSGEGAPSPQNGGRLLSPRQAAIQQDILRRR